MSQVVVKLRIKISFRMCHSGVACGWTSSFEPLLLNAVDIVCAYDALEDPCSFDLEGGRCVASALDIAWNMIRNQSSAGNG